MEYATYSRVSPLKSSCSYFTVLEVRFDDGDVARDYRTIKRHLAFKASYFSRVPYVIRKE